jgi:hypothetical protein
MKGRVSAVAGKVQSPDLYDAQRRGIETLVEQSPSLASRLSGDLARNYARALKRALLDTNLPAQTFPPQCPFSLAQVLDEDFLPD